MKRLFNKALRILLITNGVVLVAGAMLGPIYAIFVEKIGGDLLQASFTGGIFAMAAGITTLVAGRYADKIKENELIVVFGYLIMGIGFLLYIFVNSMLFLLFVQILIGFAEAIYSPAFDALFSKHISIRKAGKEWGTWEAINYFSVALGAILGGFIVTKFGFNPMFIIMSIICFSTAIYIYFLPRKIL